jgi:putative SOS response-associated peptidase YedK
MCGRYVAPAERDLEAYWHIGRENVIERIVSVFNAAPTMVLPIITHEGVRQAKWGLVPVWWKQPKPPTSTINARVEEASEKPMWRNSVRKMRCLVPALGWYEWLNGPEGKVPHFIHAPDRGLIVFAGLYSVRPLDEMPVSYAICTRDAAGSLAEIHHRMPLVLPQALWAQWLDPALQDGQAVIDAVMAGAATEFVAYPVSKYVNAPKNQGEKCIEGLVA